MDALKQARTELALEVVRLALEVERGLREGDGCLPEADNSINNASRRLVQAVQDAGGEAWLGKINLYAEDRAPVGTPVLWRWDGSLVCNFAAAFVAPRY